MSVKKLKFSIGGKSLYFELIDDEGITEFFSSSPLTNVDTLRLLYAEHLELAEKDKTILDIQEQLEKAQKENLNLKSQVAVLNERIAALNEKNVSQEASHQQQMQIFLQLAAGGIQVTPSSSAQQPVTASPAAPTPAAVATVPVETASDLVEESPVLSEEEEEARRAEERKRKQEEQRRKREEKERRKKKEEEAAREAFYTPAVDEDGIYQPDLDFFSKEGFSYHEYKKYNSAAPDAYRKLVSFDKVDDASKKEYLLDKIASSSAITVSEEFLKEYLSEEEYEYMLANFEANEYLDTSVILYFRQHRDFYSLPPAAQEIFANFLLDINSDQMEEFGLSQKEPDLGLKEPILSRYKALHAKRAEELKKYLCF